MKHFLFVLLLISLLSACNSNELSTGKITKYAETLKESVDKAKLIDDEEFKKISLYNESIFGKDSYTLEENQLSMIFSALVNYYDMYALSVKEDVPTTIELNQKYFYEYVDKLYAHIDEMKN